MTIKYPTSLRQIQLCSYYRLKLQQIIPYCHVKAYVALQAPSWVTHAQPIKETPTKRVGKLA